MRKKAVPIALLMCDLHLRHTTPPARAEKDWYPVMERQLGQLDSISREEAVPIIYPGDIFDRWDSPPELINFTLKHLSFGYAVPGQHDLPYHRYDDIRRSAYWTLVEAQKIENIPPGVPITAGVSGDLILHGYPWGYPPRPLKEIRSNFEEEGWWVHGKHVAVVHDYVYNGPRSSYHNASEEKNAVRYSELLKGYDCAVIGDNHKQWSCPFGKLRMWNGGTFFRIKSDERSHTPRVGVLYSDGTIEPRPLDVSKDKWQEDHSAKFTYDTHEDARRVVEELANLGDHALNFAEAVRHALDANRVGPRCREVVLKILEGKS